MRLYPALPAFASPFSRHTPPKAAVLAETDQTATRVYPVSHFCVLLRKNEILPSVALHGHAEIEKPAAGAECVELLGGER